MNGVNSLTETFHFVEFLPCQHSRLMGTSAYRGGFLLAMPADVLDVFKFAARYCTTVVGVVPAGPALVRSHGLFEVNKYQANRLPHNVCVPLKSSQVIHILQLLFGGFMSGSHKKRVGTPSIYIAIMQLEFWALEESIDSPTFHTINGSIVILFKT